MKGYRGVYRFDRYFLKEIGFTNINPLGLAGNTNQLVFRGSFY